MFALQYSDLIGVLNDGALPAFAVAELEQYTGLAADDVGFVQAGQRSRHGQHCRPSCPTPPSC